ncbi:hypothetical protein P691DRAFT_845679 [Macrolepiota fuliginosa MF-IS2]|uniref:HMG box domain-containing protein n=1 Tax=Macrolepiota fuliginosa MF-IS2 TaxID=1400762 RepID=A0A9P5XHU6_9AGAR|nr:hypothetical protein P691DRAFT_845679 [Macrolepiota fuliginosa MF-IS2]
MPPRAAQSARAHSERGDYILLARVIHTFIAHRSMPAPHTLVKAAVARLSQDDREVLQNFKNAFPTLKPETMGRPPNKFILFRSHYAAQVAAQEAQKEENEPKINQADVSKDARLHWSTYSDPEKVFYEKWANQIQSLWKKMWPHDFPRSSISKRKKPSIKSPNFKPKNVAPARHLSSTSHSPSIGFHHLPSPPISDAADLEQENIEDNQGSGAESEDGDLCGGDDGEYLPRKSSRKRRSPYSRPPKQKRSKVQLLTPVSVTRELPSTVHSRSPSPVPIFSDSDWSPPSTPDLHDISLSELNEGGPSAFTESPFHMVGFSSEASDDSPLFESFEQLAVGYSLEEHTNNTIMDWMQTDLMSDLDPVELYPIPNSSHFSEAATTDLANTA